MIRVSMVRTDSPVHRETGPDGWAALSVLPATDTTSARDRGPVAATKGGDPVRTGSFNSGFVPVLAVTALEKFEAGRARTTTSAIASVVE
jgi:hypothetical protein